MFDSAPFPGQDNTSIDAGLILRAVMRSLLRIGLVTAILCGAAYAVLLFVPKTYESRAELLVEPRSNAMTTATGANPEAYLIDAAAVASQIELIKSRSTIRAAIEALGLRDDPAFAGRADEQIIGNIAGNLMVTQERSSRLISIAYRSEDPDLAARLANGIAAAHVSLRIRQQISDTVETTGWLQDEIERLRSRVVEAERAIADFRVDNDLFVGANNESLTNQQLSNFSSQITAVAERRSAAQSRAQLIRALLESGQSVVGVSDVQSSSVGQGLSQELGRLHGERAQQSATLLPNHPTIRALDAQIAEVEVQIAAEGRRIASALEAQAQIEADLQASLQAELDSLKVVAGGNTIEGVTLAELEREAAAQRDLLNAYLLRYAEASARSDAESALPDVRIVSEAAPPVRASAPQTTMILLAVGIASILLQVGAVIFSELLSGRALTEAREPQIDADDETDVAVPLDMAPTDDEEEGFPVQPADSEPDEAEPAHEMQAPAIPPAPVQRPGAAYEVEVSAIAASMTAGLGRIVVIASANGETDSQRFAEHLSARLIRNGLSIAEIDAASGQPSTEPGLTDLCAYQADFGDVVHRTADGMFAYVPWGQGEELEHETDRAATLVDALSDIYECIIVVAGPVGQGSSLPLFAEIEARCVLLCSDARNGDAARDEVAALGFDVQIVALPVGRMEVA